MEKYSEYKDSGVQWIGEIPSHWRILSPRYWITRRDAGNWGADQEGNEQDAVCIRIADFDYGHLCIKKNCEYTVRNYPKEVLENLLLKRGDIIIEKSGGGDKFPVGRAVLYDLDFPALFANFSERIRVDKKYSNKYLLYTFAAHYSMGLSRLYFNQTTGIQNLIMSKFMREVKLPLPPLAEQKSIVAYLESQTSRLDSFIADVEHEIELLGEAKQKIIADAVTNGLNKDVIIENSDIYWWPKKPKHWKVSRLGHILNKQNRERLENAEFLICTNKGDVKKRGDAKIGLIASSDDINQGVKKGDLLIHGMDTWHGAIAVSEFDGMCSPVVHVCTSEENVHFVAYFMQVMAYSKIFKLISNGVRQNTSDFRSWNKLNKIPIIVPPIEEQNEIVDYISQKTSQIDTLMSSLSQQITLLKEYKQRLISDVVTGQIKVC